MNYLKKMEWFNIWVTKQELSLWFVHTKALLLIKMKNLQSLGRKFELKYNHVQLFIERMITIAWYSLWLLPLLEAESIFLTINRENKELLDKRGKPGAPNSRYWACA